MEGRRVGNEEQRCDTRVSVRSKGVLAARGTDARSHRAHMAPRTSRASRSSSGTPPQSTRGQRDAPCRSACRAWLRVHRRPGRSPLPCTRWKACRRAASRRACSWVRGARCSRRAGAVAYTRITSCAHRLGCTRARANTKAQVQESPPREQVTRGAPFRASPPPFPLLHPASSPCPCGAAAGRPAAELLSARSAAPVRRSVHCSAARARARASSHLAARTSYSTRSGHGARPGRARARGGTGRSRPQSFRTYMPLARNMCARAGNRRTSNSTCLLAETAAAAVAAFF